MVGLRKSIGLPEAIATISGVIIGSGIFMTPGIILQEVGSFGASILVWAFCGLFTLSSTLTYMELALIINESGGEYPYCYKAYGDIIGFLCAFGLAFIAKPATCVIMLYTFSEYFCALFLPESQIPQAMIKQVTITALLLCTLINLISVKMGVKITEYFLYAKVFCLLVIIISGLNNVLVGQKTQNFATNLFEGTSTDLLKYSAAFYGGMWSFDGWNQLNFIVEEMINPKRDFPRAVWISIPTVTIFYILINFAYLSVMTPNEIQANTAVAVTFAYRSLGKNFAWIIPVGVVLSTFGSTNGTVFTSARLTWATSKRNHLPEFLSYVDIYRSSPSIALVFNTFMAILITLPSASNFSTVLDYFSFVQWLFYGLASFSVIIFRFLPEYKHRTRAYKVPIILPLISTLGSLYLVVAPGISDYLERGILGVIPWLQALGLLLSGLVIYLPLKYFPSLRPTKLMTNLTIFIQKVCQVAPPMAEPSQ